MANISMDHRLIDNTDFFVLHAGHLSVTGAHYDSIADPDAVLEWFVGARWQAVEFVEIRGARHFTTERLIGHVARLTSTKSIEFVNQNISDRHAALLADLPSLTAVSITRSRILTERGVSILRARRLTRLEIVGCPNIEQPNMRFTSDQLGELVLPATTTRSFTNVLNYQRVNDSSPTNCPGLFPGLNVGAQRHRMN